MPVIEYTDTEAPGMPQRSVEVMFTRREAGGYSVVRRDTGRTLGWTVREQGRWAVYAADGAFLGDDERDSGYVLDQVPDDLTRRGPGWHAMSGSDRYEAAYELVCHLRREHAPALGYGRHPRVRRHRADNEPLRAWLIGGMATEMPR